MDDNCGSIKILENGVADITTDIGQTNNIGYDTNYIIITIILLISSRYQPLTTNQSREISTCATTGKSFLSNAHPDRFMFVCY